MFARQDQAIKDFAQWFWLTMHDDCMAFLQEFSRRFEDSGKSFAVYEVYAVRVRIMKMAYERAGRPKDAFWNKLELLHRIFSQRRVVPEGVW